MQISCFDVIITRKDDTIVNKVAITKYGISDHFMIDFIFKITPKHVFKKNITYRCIKKVDPAKFSNDISK